MAIGVLSALWQAGRRVPADVAMVSCDDIPFAEFLTPPLSTVRIPLAETGRRAVEVLLGSIAGEPVPERTPPLPVELIVRDSCGGGPGAYRSPVPSISPGSTIAWVVLIWSPEAR
jgi:DNA-binding LacI/PurR family transcriptional regulator